MANTHKYVKRTGTPGNYKYWYKMPDGSLKASDDEGSPKEHGKAKREHLRRLIQGKKKGHHRMSKQEMLAHTGVTKEELEESGNKNLFANAGRRGYQYDEHEVATAHKEEGQDKTGRAEDAPAAAAGGDDDSGSRRKAKKKVSKKKASKKATSRRRAAEAEAEAADATRTVRKKKAKKKASKKASTRRAAPEAAPAPAYTEGRNIIGTRDEMEALRQMGLTNEEVSFVQDLAATNNVNVSVEGGMIKIFTNKYPRAIEGMKEDAGLQGRVNVTEERQTDEGPSYRMEYKTDMAIQAEDEAASQEAAGEEGGDDNVQSLLDKLKDDYGIDLGGGEEAGGGESDEVAARRARAAAARAQAVASPSGATARELHQEEPELATADEPLARMEEAAREGGNPYLERAKEVFGRIRGDIKPERAKVAEHIFQAIENLGSGFTEDQLLQEYKNISGKRVRSLGIAEGGAAKSSGVASEFEKATFMTLDEVMKNEPIDMEYERMRRGYGAMQFARMKPFVKDSWHESNPDAPPPYPTFNDLKSWSEHGVDRPASMSWTTPTGRAGGVTKAMPQEFFDSVVKDASGRPQNPPGNMPLHLMPVWNYVVKRSLQTDQNPYNTQNDYVDQSGRVNLGARSSFQEGMLKNAMRKYVQFRGGADQLPDIPKSAAAKAGMSRADLFKSEDGEQDVMEVAQRKIIDPVALLPFVKAEMASPQEPEEKIGKSIRLVIDADRPEVSFQKSFTVSMKKSEMIKRIKDLKRKFVVGR